MKKHFNLTPASAALLGLVRITNVILSQSAEQETTTITTEK